MGTTTQPTPSSADTVVSGRGSWEGTLVDLYAKRTDLAERYRAVCEQIKQIEGHMILDQMELPKDR